jgi:hypothetical protein
MQVYTRPKNFWGGSSLAFNLKEDPVRCVKVCDKSWVILLYLSLPYCSSERYELYGLYPRMKKKLLVPYLVLTNKKWSWPILPPIKDVHSL